MYDFTRLSHYGNQRKVDLNNNKGRYKPALVEQSGELKLPASAAAGSAATHSAAKTTAAGSAAKSAA